MGVGISHACFKYWWAWDHPDVTKAVLAGFSPHLLCLVEKQFLKHRQEQAKGRPTELPDLWALRSEGTIRRLLSGQRDPTSPLVLGLASLLAVEPGSLFPKLCEWIAESTVYLASPRVAFSPLDLKRVVGFDRSDAVIYAEAVLGSPPRGIENPREIESFLGSHHPSVRTVAVRIAGPLADYHDQMQREVEKRRNRDE